MQFRGGFLPCGCSHYLHFIHVKPWPSAQANDKAIDRVQFTMKIGGALHQ